MKCKLPNQETGSTRILLPEMAEEYDAPGKEVKETEDGVKYVEVVQSVGRDLVELRGFEEMDNEDNQNDYEVKNDDTN